MLMINDYLNKNPNVSFENLDLDDSIETKNELINSNYYKLKVDETRIILVETKQELMTFLDEIISSKKSDLTLNTESLSEFVFVGVDTGTKIHFNFEC
jgi:hypothetical protein